MFGPFKSQFKIHFMTRFTQFLRSCLDQEIGLTVFDIQKSKNWASGRPFSSPRCERAHFSLFER